MKQKENLIKIIMIKMIITLFLLLLAISTCCRNGNANNTFIPISEVTDWQPQDYFDSRGIRSVQVDLGKKRLILDAHLIGGDSNYTNGEVFLDLRYVPGLEGKVPIDMNQTIITVQVEIPVAFDGWESKPNGVQVFVKDNKWKSQYGTWVNITNGGKYKAVLRPDTGEIYFVHTDPGLDPTKIIIIGVKFAIGTGSTAHYDGSLYITNISIEPPLELSPFPSLPSTAPPPTFAEGDKIEVKPDGFYLNNKKWLIIGGNWRIIEYGQNFGVTAWFPSGNGISKHPNFVRVNLENFSRAGIKVLRVGLLEDGRTVFDKDGHLTGYDEILRKDVRTLLDLAWEAKIKVEFVLFDYLIAGKPMLVDGVWVRGREEIIIDENRKAEFISGFLIPLLNEFGSHPTLIGFDIINEPEWVISRQDGGDWESVTDTTTKPDSPIPGEKMKDFITACISTIHAHAPGKFVTVGISCKFIPLVQNLAIDYFALHHYAWMDELRDYLSLLPGGKPWSLEEYPINETSSITSYLDLVLETGGAGALLWNLSPGIDEYTFTYEERDAKLIELRNWIGAHIQNIY